MQFRQIEAFRAVVIGGSVSAAAAMLGITQPAVSRLLQDLEAALDMDLFQRVKGRLIPTADAMTLYREIERSFTGLARIRQAAEDLKQRRLGSLHVAALPALASGVLPRFAAGFLQARPKLRLTLSGLSSPEVLDRVSTGQCDIGLVGHSFHNPAVTRVPLPVVRAVAVLPRRHRLAARRQVRAEDLEGEACIGMAPPSQLQHKVDLVMRTHGVSRHLVVETPLSVIVCRLAALGLGLGIVDPFTAEDCRQEGIAIRPFVPAITVEWSVVHPAFSPPSGVVSDFIEGIVAHIAGHYAAAA